MTRLHVNGSTLLRAVAAATANLERHVDEVDALNVFPVPDGDTGSNMLATMRAALAEAERIPEGERDLQRVADALSRGALTGARGNSGVILSQIIRGMTEGTEGRRASGVHLARGLRKGSEVAYGSVLTPVEGTILTVIRDAADAAEAAAGRQPHVEAVLADVIEAAASSVQRTPTLLPILEDAGVVDSGGQGLYRVLEGMLQLGAVAGGPSVPPAAVAAANAVAAGPMTRSGSGASHHVGPDEHGYETQYMLASSDGAIDVTALRAAIDAIGTSVVVAGDGRLARVHVHGERPDLAIAAGMRYGRLSQIDISDLDAQVSGHRAPEAPGEPAPVQPSAPSKLALVAATGAPGLARVLASLGAHIVRPGHGTRVSVGEIAAAAQATGAELVIVLPNDRDAVLAARLAASLTSEVGIKVVATRNAAEGIAAAVTFDPGISADENVSRMEAEALALRSFTVFTAAKDSVVDGVEVRAGDVIAADATRRVLATGNDVEDTTMAALAQLEDFELVTVYRGNGQGEAEAGSLSERIEAAGWGVEVEIVDGGQPHDHLLVAVE